MALQSYDIIALLLHLSPENAPNIALFVIGFAGTLLALCTLRRVEKQTIAIEKQTKHLVESERPFLMVEVIGDENHASFRVCNRGKSPAKILFMDRMLNATYLPIGEKLPLVPEYGQQYHNIFIGAEPVNAEWVSPRGHTFIGSVSPKGEIATLRSYSSANPLAPSAVWHFGAIIYKGLFSDMLYESRYCYRLLDNHWRMLGPYGYNEYK
ncbi:MAG TPA: hypothetical protein VK638_41355 [Edaphobacter sp.]|nr:hypothetical protein [Edaphobacter sp.]